MGRVCAPRLDDPPSRRRGACVCNQVLTQWPRIYDALSGNATLAVLYGFTPAFMKHIGDSEESRAWLVRMQLLLRQPGVQYVGLVDHDELARQYAEAGFFLYPTSYPETGCIAAMKVCVCARCCKMLESVAASCDRVVVEVRVIYVEFPSHLC